MTFAEKVSGLTTPHSRHTPLLREALTRIGLTLAGRAGARLLDNDAEPAHGDITQPAYVTTVRPGRTLATPTRADPRPHARSQHHLVRSPLHLLDQQRGQVRKQRQEHIMRACGACSRKAEQRVQPSGLQDRRGVDTRKDVHVATVVSHLGALLGTQSFPDTASGYRQITEREVLLGVVRQAGVEGTGSHGAGLARHLTAEGIEVIEVNRPGRAARHRSGKTDPVDAEAAA
nr:transposase [Streptomyces sp. NBC_01497]